MNTDGLNNQLPTPIGGVDEEHLSVPVNQISNNPVIQNNSTTNNSDNHHNSVSNQSAFSLNPLTAEDDNLIEKDWVNRLEKAISANQDDPYLLLKEISSIKSDYLKKRFNKISQSGVK